MGKIVLIHGYAVGLISPVVRPFLGPSAGMRAFEPMIKSGEAVLFRWGTEQKVPPWRLLDPFFLRYYYQTERRLCLDHATHERLRFFLDRERPEALICHSMGSVLLHAYLQNFSIPDSVRNIIFVQSDLPADIVFKSPVLLYNMYCPWDPTLLISSLCHRSWRAGVMPLKNTVGRNILFPLVRPINLHTSSIRDPEFPKFLHTLLSSRK